MLSKAKIALEVPARNDRYFSFRLKQHLDEEPAEYPRPKNLFVVSDIEGNFHSFSKLLLKGKVIDQSLQWTFEDGHLVIVGDCFDRGPEVIECLWLIYSLEEKARHAGGYVHFILGNHEIMNMNGDWRYVHPRYAKKTFPAGNSPAALYDANNEIWRWLHTKNIIEKIGDILFVHGGIAPELLQFKLSVAEINELARSHYNDADAFFEDPLLQVLFDGEHSPVWYRGYYYGTAGEDLIDATLAHYGVQTIVTGHTLVDKVTTFFNGKLINVDTDHANGQSEALLIRKNRYYCVRLNGRGERLK